MLYYAEDTQLKFTFENFVNMILTYTTICLSVRMFVYRICLYYRKWMSEWVQHSVCPFYWRKQTKHWTTYQKTWASGLTMVHTSYFCCFGYINGDFGISPHLQGQRVSKRFLCLCSASYTIKRRERKKKKCVWPFTYLEGLAAHQSQLVSLPCVSWWHPRTAS